VVRKESPRLGAQKKHKRSVVLTVCCKYYYDVAKAQQSTKEDRGGLLCHSGLTYDKES